MAGTTVSHQPWQEHYSKAWPKNMGAQTKTIKLKFDGDIHKDGTAWRIARLLPGNNYSNIKVRTEGLPGLKIDLGCSGHTTDCKGCRENEDLTYFASELDVGAKLCGDLDCGPWDCSGSCAPECCDDPLEDDCATDAKTHIAEAHDMVLTLHGDAPDCGVLHLTFTYTIGG